MDGRKGEKIFPPQTLSPVPKENLLFPPGEGLFWKRSPPWKINPIKGVARGFVWLLGGPPMPPEPELLSQWGPNKTETGLGPSRRAAHKGAADGCPSPLPWPAGHKVGTPARPPRCPSSRRKAFRMAGNGTDRGWDDSIAGINGQLRTRITELVAVSSCCPGATRAQAYGIRNRCPSPGL